MMKAKLQVFNDDDQLVVDKEFSPLHPWTLSMVNGCGVKAHDPAMGNVELLLLHYDPVVVPVVVEKEGR
jgi:hypothetical protein